MRQQQFETQREERWQQFERLLDALDRSGGVDRQGEFPRRFRQICQDLALARDRLFTEELVLRLNRLALRGHEHLYRSRSASRRALLELLWVAFPRALRREARLFLALCALFFGSLALSAWSVFLWPELPRSFFDLDTLTGYETMYGEEMARTAADDVGMFGFYIANNISIAFRMFAGGLLFGIGSLLVLLTNGIFIGLIAGHVVAAGHGQNFLPFVLGHGSFELTAIVIAAVAGTRMGFSLIAPGRLSRLHALRRSTEVALPLLYGTGIMLAIAAAIEAFWSPSSLDASLKYGVAAALWVGVAAYLTLAGRRAA